MQGVWVQALVWELRSHMLCSAAKKSIKKHTHTTFLSLILLNQLFIKSFPGGSVVKNLTASADAGSVPGSGRSTEGGNGNPLQYSCLENTVERGAWRATVHRIAKELTQEFMQLSN